MSYGRLSKKIVAFGAFVTFLAMSFAGLAVVSPAKADGAVLAANKTEILFDGEEIQGLKGFTYKVYKDRQDVRGIGMNGRFRVVYGRLGVKGKILVHSNSELLDVNMNGSIPFRITVSVMQDSYPEGMGLKQIVFYGCHVDDREFQLDGNGDSLVVYSFSARSFVLHAKHLVWQEKLEISFSADDPMDTDATTFPKHGAVIDRHTDWEVWNQPLVRRGTESFITAYSYTDSYGSQLITARYADGETSEAGIVGWWGESDVSAMSLLGIAAGPVVLASTSQPSNLVSALESVEDVSLFQFFMQMLDDTPLTKLLNKHMDNNTSFQIILSAVVMQDSYPEGLGLKQFTFDGCLINDRQSQMDSHGYALTTYTFTSDRLRED